jgi:hypothetical protein
MPIIDVGTNLAAVAFIIHHVVNDLHYALILFLVTYPRTRRCASFPVRAIPATLGQGRSLVPT